MIPRISLLKNTLVEQVIECTLLRSRNSVGPFFFFFFNPALQKLGALLAECAQECMLPG